MTQYKGCTGKVEFDDEADIFFHGEAIGLRASSSETASRPRTAGLNPVQRGASVCSVFAWFAISLSLNHQYRFSPFMKGSI